MPATSWISCAHDVSHSRRLRVPIYLENEVSGLDCGDRERASAGIHGAAKEYDGKRHTINVEGILGAEGTARTWKVVRKLVELAGQASP